MRELAAKYGLSIPQSELLDWATLLAGLNQNAKEVLALPDYYPEVDYNLYPRTDIRKPEGEAQDKGAWACKATVKCTKPTGDVIKGLKVAL